MNFNGVVMKIRVKKLNKKAIIPTKGSAQSAGYDLYACLERDCIEIPPQSCVKIGTGLSIEVPNGYFGAIFARSGLATKQNLRPANCVGVADSDYRGEYIVALYNDSTVHKIINNGERIAQLVIMPYLDVEFTETENLSETDRADGGFGSTGK